MAKQVESLFVRLGIQGYEELNKLKSAFRSLDTTLNQSDATLDKARKAILDYGRTAQQSEALLKGMADALKGLQSQADVSGSTFAALDNDIKRLKADLYGASAAVDAEREALVKNANAVKTNSIVVGRYIGELKKLRASVRDNSEAAQKFDKDIAALTARMLELRDVQLKDIVVGSVKGAQTSVQGLQSTVQGTIAMFRRLGEQSKTALGVVGRSLEGITAIGIGGAVTGGAAGAVGGYGQLLSGTVSALTGAKSTLSGLPMGLGRVAELIPDSAIANLTEATGNIAALQGQLASLDAAMDGITQAFTAFGPSATAGAIAASVGIAAVYDQLRKKADETKKELETTFKAVNDEVQQLLENTAKLGDQLNRLSVTKLNELLGSARSRFAFAPAGSPLSRAMASQIAGLESVLAKEQAAQAQVLEEYRQRVRGGSTALTDLAERLAFVQQRMKVVDTSTQEGAREFASLSREALDLTSKMTALGDSYRHVSTMATQAATAQQNAANAVMRQNYLNRGAARAREEALVELGERVRQGVAATPQRQDYPGSPRALLLPAAGGTSAPGTGREISGGARRLRGQVEYTFQEPMGNVPSYLRDPRYTALRGEATTAATGVTPAGGYTYKDRQTGEYRRVGVLPEPPKPTAYTEALNALRAVRQRSDDTIASLNNQRSAWARLRDVVDPTTATFRNATTRVQELEKRLDELSLTQKEVQQPQRGFNAGRLAQTAGAALSGAVFGGPEGFLGGVVGGIAGGPGGAFAVAAAGAQVAMLRQAAGGAAEYAAAIDQQRRALSGVIEDSAAYQQSLAFIDQTSRQLAIPQEQVTRNFTRLSASVLGAGGDVAAAQEAFMGISAGIRATGGTLGDLDAALLATAQVFSKGKVSAEELRGQIGERLPGAFTLFAKSINKTPQELDKMLEKGEVSLNDFMSFVRLMSSEFGQQSLKMASSSEAAGDRLTTAMGRMQEEVGKALQPIGAQFQEIFADLITGSGPAVTSILVAIGQATLTLTQVVVSSVRGIQAVLDTLRQQVQNIVDTWMARWRILTDFISSAFTMAARTVGVDLQWLSGVFSGVAYFIEDVFSRVFSGVASRWKETVSNMINYSTPLGWVAKLMGVDPGKAVVAGIQAAGGGGRQSSAQPQYTPLPRSTATFGTGETDAAGDAKEKKGPKPPEDRTLELRAEADLFNKTAAAENAIRDALFEGKELKAADLEFQKQELQILHERDKALQAANYEGEKQAIRTMAELKILDATLRLEDRRREIKNAQFQAELQNQQAVRDAAEPIENIRKAQEQQLSNAKQYMRLVSEGMLPAEAQRIMNFEQTVKQQQEALDLQIDITEAAIKEAEARGVATADLRKELDLLRRKRKAVDTAAAQGPGRGQTNIERIEGALAATKGELNELTNLGNLVVNSANAIGDAFGQAFRSITSGAASTKEVLAEFFQNVANAFLDMAAQIIAKQVVMVTLQAILKALGGASGGAAGGEAFGVSPEGGGLWGGMSLGEMPAAGAFGSAQGNVFSPQGHVERYAQGGVVTAPTMFRFAKGSGFAPGLMGEAGPEAILPLQRTPSGDLGVRATLQVPYASKGNKDLQVPYTRAGEQYGTMTGDGMIRFESTVINNQEFVTKDEAERIGQAAASRGAEIAQRRMKNSPQVRRSLGIA